MKFTKTHINIIIVEVVVIAIGVTAILLKEITARLNINVLPELKREATSVISPSSFALPSASKISRIADEKLSRKGSDSAPSPKIKDVQEVTIEITDEPPKKRLREALKEREEKPEEKVIEFE